MGGVPDYIVTSRAEWDTVFANDAATLAGKIVEVAAPIAEAVNITNRDFSAAGAPLTIRSANAGSFLGRLELYTLVRGVDFSGLNFQLTGWPKAFDACVQFGTGTFDQLRFVNGTTFRHGYGASLANIDTSADLPEYERIDNVQTATTTSATYALTWKDPAATQGMIEFFNRGANSVRVAVGGSDVVATGSSQLVNAGARFRFGGLNPTTATHFAVLATTGTSEVNARTEIGLATYLGSAFQAFGSASMQSIEIRNCLFRDLVNGAKGLGTPSSVVVMDNDFDRIYADIIAVPPAAGGSGRFLRNIATIPFCRSGIAENLNGDAGDPHGDIIQMFGAGAGTISNVRIAGNRMRATALRTGVTQQGVFISDNDTNPSYADFVIISNTFVGGSTFQLAIGEGAFSARDTLVHGVSILDYSNVANPAPTVKIDTDQGGSVYVGKSIYGQLVVFAEAPQQDGNLRLPDAASPAAVFPNLGNLAAATTRAEIEAALATAAEGAGLGAVATANAIDWTTTDPEAVILWENVPSGVHWNPLTQQDPDTLITLPLRKVLNKRPDQPVSVTAGTEWRSVDTDGTTEVQAWTSSPGTIQPGQFIQIRGTTAASGGTIMLGLSLNLFSQNVSVTSASIPTAYLVRGATAGYFVDPANVPSGTSRITFRAQVWLPSLSGAPRLFTQESTGCDLWVGSSGQLVANIEDSTGTAMIFSANVAPDGTIVAETWHEIIFDVDQVAEEVRVTVDGVLTTTAFTAASSGTFQTSREVSFLAQTAGAFAVAAGTRVANLEVDFNGTLHKAISNDATTANADAWHRGGDFAS
ncbi:hypothetical protein [Erythrobacter dokdonensis]|uniref:Uncharacterized protein n=1 Tax=Erythrobacter dokdonensis DSW-74 TaxID=1300349 RepID=A0A1A7BHL4_9SPHN|nr:hypothetical protein [Erythrobacter dokdonensis]OBV11211.1 hypothetical protein I603_1619 [Erythrobacter dokdonensis DSW-74]